jgi:ubiquinone/menaquinone biosynthesis C-methylase UbiE
MPHCCHGHTSRRRGLRAAGERLPFPDGSFDLIVSTTSFDHWSDQQAGLRECARTLSPGGRLILVDLFSGWLAPTLIGPRRHKARTLPRAARLLTAAGFTPPTWHPIRTLIKAATAAT